MEKEVKLWELRGKLIFISRKTRAKFPHNLPAAPRGFVCLVVTTWESRYTGTQKLIVINQNGEEYGTTAKCIELIETKLNEKWKKLKDDWEEANSIPVVAKCIDFTRKNDNGQPYGAFFKLLNGKSFTLTRRSLYQKWPDNLEKGKVVTIWLPIWKAKRIGLIKNDDK